MYKVFLGVEVQGNRTDEAYIEILRNRLGLAEDTICYLLDYRYGAELVKRIAEAVK